MRMISFSSPLQRRGSETWCGSAAPSRSGVVLRAADLIALDGHHPPAPSSEEEGGQ